MKKIAIVFIVLLFTAPAFALNFSGFISANVPWTTTEKVAFLDDFCGRWHYETEKKIGESKAQFLNRKVAEYLTRSVNQQRKWAAEKVVAYEALGEIPE